MKVYLVGLVVLVVAIAANALAKLLRISTWYDFFLSVTEIGVLPALKNISFLSAIWLFILYPVILGSTAYVLYKHLF
jgi:hypothetical protein